MKLEIDLSTIFADEEGGPVNLQQAVEQQVVTYLADYLKDGVARRVDEEVSRVLNQELAIAVKSRMDGIVDDLMNAEFIPVDRWGSKGKVTTFRGELVKAIQENMVYSPKQYGSDENAFTKAVKAVIEQQMATFKKEFDAKVNAEFVAKTLEYAVATLKKRLNLA